jgi:hypothetical protein
MMAALNIYYACTLSFNVREEVFRRYIEPVIYVISITASVISPTFLVLKADMLNPGVNDPFCGPAIYPEGCNKEDDPDCRGTPSDSRNYLQAFIFVFTLGFGTLIITMGSVIYTFHKREKRVEDKLKSSTETETNEDESTAKELENAQKMTKIISKQALMYIGAFVITWIMTILAAVEAIGAFYWVQVLRMIFQPLQGFFNMLIFFYHKVNIIRRNDEDRTVGDALRIIFKSPRESPEFVLVYNIEDVLYNDFALPKIISSNNKLIILSNDHTDAKDSAAESQIIADSFLKQVDMFVSRGGHYDTATSEKKCKAQLACQSMKLHHDLSLASLSFGDCSTDMQEGLAPAVSSDELPIDEENDGTGNARCRANELL